ncbi:MAG: hypothetical protein KAX78_00615, partial [Phycisphaerae bacterium]|nr:hypothetical protein [Phycisphaerae bacterium]
MKSKHSPEQIVAKLRQADVGLGKGLKVPEVCVESRFNFWLTFYCSGCAATRRNSKNETAKATFGL